MVRTLTVVLLVPDCMPPTCYGGCGAASGPVHKLLLHWAALVTLSIRQDTLFGIIFASGVRRSQTTKKSYFD
jgi:hypothetical protein